MIQASIPKETGVFWLNGVLPARVVHSTLKACKTKSG